jgi:hypothetical protein
VPITTPTIAPAALEFLADFPEFDTTLVTDPAALQFSPSAITYWLTVAGYMLNQSRWGNLYYTGIELFAAHNLSLEAWSSQGGPQTVPGIAKGPIASTGAGDVSVAYNTAAVLELDAGHWAYTTYGQRMIHLIRLMGVGPLYVGGGFGFGGYGCGGGYGYGGGFFQAWQGPWTFNVPNPNG